jgi:antitoxin ParD1/3/4
MTAKTSISLTDDQYAFAKAMVEAGRYPSVSAVLQQGVDLLRRKLEEKDAEATALRALLARRRAGHFISGEAMDKRIDAIVADKRRHRAVSD